MTFDPDKYLADNDTEFDPDAYLTEETINEPEQPSQAEAIGRGAVQGATFGFADELGATALTPFEKARQFISQYVPGTPEAVDKKLQEQGFTGDIEQPGVLETYRQLRDTAREADVAAEKTNPATYLTGEIAGGVVPAIASGGSAILGSAGKTALKEAAKQAVRKSGQEITKQALKNAARTQALKQASIAGGIMGAGYGAGKSEADITKGDIGEFTGDVTQEAITGAAMGGAIPVVGQGIKAGAGAVKKIAKGSAEWLLDSLGSEVRTIAEAYKRTKEGQKVIGKKVADEVHTKLRSLGDELSNKLVKKEMKTANKMYDKALTGETKFNKTLQDYQQKLSKIEEKNLGESDQKIIDEIKGLLRGVQNINEKYTPDLQKLPTKEEAKALLERVRQKEIAAAQILPPEQKAFEKVVDKTTKQIAGGKDVLPEMVQPKETLIDLPNLGNANRKFIQTIDEDTNDIMAQEILKGAGVGPIQKIAGEGGEQFLGFKRGLQTPKMQQIQPDDLYKDAEIPIQRLFDLSQDVKSTIPEEGVLKKYLPQFQRELEGDITSKMSPEKQAILKAGKERWQDIHAVGKHLGEDIIDPMDAAKRSQKAQEVGIKQLGSLSGFTPNETRQAQPALDMALDRIKKIDPQYAQELEKNAVELSKRLQLSLGAENYGASTRTIGMIENLGIRGAAAVGKSVNLLTSIKDAPKKGLIRVSEIANQTNKPRVANFFNAMVEKTPQGRSALMFSAMQNPELKADILEVFGVENERKK